MTTGIILIVICILGIAYLVTEFIKLVKKKKEEEEEELEVLASMERKAKEKALRIYSKSDLKSKLLANSQNIVTFSKQKGSNLVIQIFKKKYYTKNKYKRVYLGLKKKDSKVDVALFSLNDYRNKGYGTIIVKVTQTYKDVSASTTYEFTNLD